MKTREGSSFVEPIIKRHLEISTEKRKSTPEGGSKGTQNLCILFFSTLPMATIVSVPVQGAATVPAVVLSDVIAERAYSTFPA